MEEKKKQAKEVKMEVPEQAKEATQKLTYDQLNQVCGELSQQNQQLQQYAQRLAKQNQQLIDANMIKRLDYLFMVLKYSTMFDGDFVGDCVVEIKQALTIPKEQAENKAE